ncbi:Flagellar hook-basal body complex protein FliE [hydrothermal vent metagenome]|uniref:Flagellar hook-basal body complex protein FliE n=1 Tax=hydrothermal vent metagenome TaxID=652676 RepID=A0A3B0WW17_9ZZZZ
MSQIDTQSLMLQMRSLAAQAQAKPVEELTESSQTGQEKVDGFSDLLAKSIEGVNTEMHKSGSMKKAFEKGDPDMELSEVMLQAQKASLSFQAMTQIRNKLVEAYKTVINMPM